MSNLKVGYLFKKKYITYQKKKYEVFEFVDYVTGISFTNKQYNDVCNIISGNNAGIYASIINKNSNEGEYVFLTDDIDSAVKDNDNSVDFAAIRKQRIQSTAKYYLRDNGTNLTRLLNEDLISYIEGDNKIRQILMKMNLKKIVIFHLCIHQ